MPLKYVAIPASAILDDRLNAQQLRTLSVIAYYGSLRDQEAYASYKTLCSAVGIGRRLLIRYINHLCALGYVEKKPRHNNNGSRSTNTYSVNLNIIINPDLGQEVEEYCETQGCEPGSDKHRAIMSRAQNMGGVVASSTTPPSGVQHHGVVASSTTPIKNTILNKKDKNKYSYKKASPKITLAQWEEKNGQLSASMFENWIKENRARASEIAELVAEFRESMQAKETLYVDFVAAFQNWLRRGYLSKSLAQIREKERVYEEEWNMGMRP